MSKSYVIKKTFKYLLYLLLLMALVLVLLIAYVLHTESGSRFAIKQGIGFAKIDLSYDSITGNLSDGLVIKNMRYQDQTIDINVKNNELTLMLTAIQIGEYPGWIICYEISVFAPDCSDIT